MSEHVDHAPEQEEYTPVVLDAEAAEEYQAMGLPDCPPNTFYRALAVQLDRLPLLELDAEHNPDAYVAA